MIKEAKKESISPRKLNALKEHSGQRVQVERLTDTGIKHEEGILNEVWERSIILDGSSYPLRGRFEGIRQIHTPYGRRLYTNYALPSTNHPPRYIPQFED